MPNGNNRGRRRLHGTKWEEKYPFAPISITFKGRPGKKAPSAIEQLTAIPGQWYTGVEKAVKEQAGKLPGAKQYRDILKALGGK